MVTNEKPEELVKAMEAIKNACKAVNSEFAENPLGEKPASLTQSVVKAGQLYGVVKELYRAVESISEYLESIGHKADATKKLLTRLTEVVDASFTRGTNGSKQPPRTMTPQAFREYLSKLAD